jgi:hypothetical protein
VELGGSSLRITAAIPSRIACLSLFCALVLVYVGTSICPLRKGRVLGPVLDTDHRIGIVNYHACRTCFMRSTSLYVDVVDPLTGTLPVHLGIDGVGPLIPYE